MAINFSHIYFLLLLIPAIFLVVWWIKTQRRVQGNRKYAIAVIRIIFFTCLILAIAGLSLLFPIDSETVVFLVDRSTSMNDDARINQFIREAIDTKEELDKFAIVSFGENAVIEQPLTTSTNFNELGGIINQHATNIEEGLRLASSMIPSNSKGKIILITDGLETSGNASQEIEFAKERDIEIDVHYLRHEIGNEVLVKSLTVPNKLYLNEEFEERVVIESTVETEGTLILYEGNNIVGQTSVSIEKGENIFSYQLSAEQTGFQKYRVELITDEDNIQSNNQAYAFTQIESSPKVLVVEGHDGSAANLVNALNASQINVEVKEPSLLPKEFEDYKQYSSIILSDTQATQFTNDDMLRIQTAVRDLGIGLIMSGGGDSFGLGGWFKTPIEEALPVDMEIKNKETNPSLALMLVIDKSGSMSVDSSGINKIELAKEGAIRSSEMLTENDQIGVIAFDGTPWSVVEMQPATDLDKIHEEISGIYADGGTDIYLALQLAYESLIDVEAQIKHIILLTDGQSGGISDYQNLITGMEDENITVSTVGIGRDSDSYLLDMIADMGNGRYYFCDNAMAIPQIFSKETALASRTYILEKPQIPIKYSINNFSTLNSSLPAINAYIATTPKQTANVVLMSQDDDPILATWQYGLGRAAAWTSDIEGKWSADWVIWENNSQFWNQLVSFSYPQITEGNWVTSVEMNGLKGTVNVEIAQGILPQNMEATIINENMESETIKLKPVAPDKLQSDFIADGEGTYVIQINEKEDDGITASQTEGVNISYSPEYGILSGGEERVNEIINISGGEIIENPEIVFADSEVLNWEQRDISNILLIIATILWPIDIGIRRINFSFALKDKISRLRKGKGDKVKTNNRTNDLENLITKKDRYKDVKDVKEVNKVNEAKKSTITYGKENIIKKEKSATKEKKTINDKKQEKKKIKEQKTSMDDINRLLNAKNKK